MKTWSLIMSLVFSLVAHAAIQDSFDVPAGPRTPTAPTARERLTRIHAQNDIAYIITKVSAASDPDVLFELASHPLASTDDVHAVFARFIETYPRDSSRSTRALKFVEPLMELSADLSVRETFSFTEHLLQLRDLAVIKELKGWYVRTYAPGKLEGLRMAASAFEHPLVYLLLTQVIEDEARPLARLRRACARRLEGFSFLKLPN